MVFKKYNIVVTKLDPTKGSEQKGTRPCIILQNDIANNSRIKTTVIAPLTTSYKKTPSSILITPSKKNKLQQTSRLELTQLRVIDKIRVIKKVGILDEKYHPELLKKIKIFFDLNDDFTEFS